MLTALVCILIGQTLYFVVVLTFQFQYYSNVSQNFPTQLHAV